MTTAPIPEALTVPEVMAALRLGRSKLYDLLRSRELDSFKIGRSRRITVDSLTAYLRNQTNQEY
ncbi:helix-turn-helix domain-containing protein [Streptomyces sp. H39-S7]|uniref:helix-turn-helix domain-containing protein n=1 Tax=Streptomyces sp. H39-S7 TaxID=3004357 RepID=UPI0022AED9B0|nr:helix-turn-helix domain-containing protein [Streptomyces sp. H39-S7]MCZ4122383.1 helix-turn-helix domain-containing protein [Streptomyces sp. H39-S7]